MRNFKSILAAIIIVATVSMVSCKDNKAETKTETTEKQGKEYTSVYVCPMHCKDSGSDKEGKCDTCGMTLVKNEDHKANGHKHE
ncbi:heavy metal-binding domain-containing protein [Nonlabens ulvanivorans]|nr:heavy metal-binding domain-containing protein [Nonlabens ulvanivorans]